MQQGGSGHEKLSEQLEPKWRRDFIQARAARRKVLRKDLDQGRRSPWDSL